jgi:hypothetical protein
MDVRRVHPLSVQLGHDGLDPMVETVMVALAALNSARSHVPLASNRATSGLIS